MKPLPLRNILAILLLFDATAGATVTNIAYYPLGEPGSIGGSQPYTPLKDTIGGHDIPSWNTGAFKTWTNTAGLVAPGSTVALEITNNIDSGGTWYGSSYNAGAGLTNNWAFDIYVRPDSIAGTFLFATDGAYSAGTTAQGWRLWAANSSSSHTLLNGSILPAGHNYLMLSRFNSSSQNENLGSASATYTQGTWVRATAVLYSGQLLYYLNEQLVDLTTNTTTGLINDIRLGAGYNAGQSTDAAFDELRVWTFDPNTDSLATVTNTIFVPEPSSLGLVALAAGLAAAGTFLRRKR